MCEYAGIVGTYVVPPKMRSERNFVQGDIVERQVRALHRNSVSTGDCAGGVVCTSNERFREAS